MEGRFNQRKYRKIIDTNYLPFEMEKHGCTTDVFPQVNSCSPYRAKRRTKYFYEKDASHMRWCAQSLDLSPIYNVRGYLRQILRKRAELRSTTIIYFLLSVVNRMHYLTNISLLLFHSILTRMIEVKRVLWFYQILNAC